MIYTSFFVEPVTDQIKINGGNRAIEENGGAVSESIPNDIRAPNICNICRISYLVLQILASWCFLITCQTTIQMPLVASGKTEGITLFCVGFL